MNPWRVIWGQVGRPSLRRRSLAMLLRDNEVPNGPWDFRRQRSWRPGPSQFASADAGRRGRQSGAFAAFRVFEHQTLRRTLTIGVRPCASVKDAEELVPELFGTLRRVRRNPRPVVITNVQRAQDRSVPGLDDAWIYEMSSIHPIGPTREEYVIGHVDHVVFSVFCLAVSDRWLWDQVCEVVIRQRDKLALVTHP
jgi:hypothetical protein